MNNRLEVMLFEVLNTDKEFLLGFGDSLFRLELDARQFERTEQIRRLKEPILRRRHLRHENRLRREKSERLLKQRLNLPLPVIVIDLQRVIRAELISIIDQESDHLLQQFIMDRPRLRDELLVDRKAPVRIR